MRGSWFAGPASKVVFNIRSIRVPTIISDGAHDGAIKRQQTEEMAALIPNAGLLIQPGVSPFSMLQVPQQFNANVLHFSGIVALGF